MRDPADAARALAAEAALIARGNGRAYGDAALSRHCVLSTLKSDLIRSFDPASGEITCEAGLLLADLLDFAVPRGFFPPVSPGTKFVTVGGMVAADVHGKNHHRAGCFSAHLNWIELLLPDGSTAIVSRTQRPDLFAATCGGMGLTGIILQACFRLTPIETALIRQETLRTRDLAETLERLEASADWTYSVAWVDSLARGPALGRGIIQRGEHARREELGGRPATAGRRLQRVPFDLPAHALNRWTIRLFNEAYYRRARPGGALVDYDRYFYPLDALLDWNRLYGRRGFLQYQCVVPKGEAMPALRALLELSAGSGEGSFLSVLKLFGPQGIGPLSFPMDGCTLALDFPNRPATHALFAKFDEIVRRHGGRLYLAKDAHMSREMLAAGYPRLGEFVALRRSLADHGKLTSLQSERLGL